LNDLIVPDGFVPHTRKSAVTAPWEPLYACVTADAFILGLHIRPEHCNGRGLLHGGVIAALADNAMGLSAALRYDPAPGLVTVNLSVDYLGMAKLGHWVDFTTNFVKTGATLAFTSCLINADGVPCAKAAATFRVGPR
jgi:uncharacterized protein (TIGR00369 family)